MLSLRAVRKGRSPRAADRDMPTETARLPITAFPAAAYATLARAYAAGRAPGDLERQARLTWAVMGGRV